jgi:hypothetical protein
MVGFLEAFDLQMMLVVAVSGLSKFIGGLYIGAHLFQIALIQVIALSGHALFKFLAPSDRSRLNEVKFHACSSRHIAAVAASRFRK